MKRFGSKRASRSDERSTTSERRRRSRSPSFRAVKQTGKTIRGILTGSKKSKSSKPVSSVAATAAAANESLKSDSPSAQPTNGVPPVAEDDETVYNVELEPSSVVSSKASTAAASAPDKATTDKALGDKTASTAAKENVPSAAAPEPAKEAPPAPSSAAPTPSGPSIQVVLLLMDSKTRRFELLQLEFDSTKALVSDVLAQIPLSATEDCLRGQQYTGVCDRHGQAMINQIRLAEFCTGSNDVVLAIPEGMNAKECTKLAKPILSDPKVIAMLNPSGGENVAPSPPPPPQSETTTSKPAPPKVAAEPPQKKTREVLAPVKEEPKKEKKKKKTHYISMSVTAAFVAAGMAYLLNLLHNFSVTPLAPGMVLKPGDWRSRCGLLSVFPESRTGCHPNAIEMGFDGVLRMHDGKDVLWEMIGSVCAEDDESCVDGLKISEDGTIKIGGRNVQSVAGEGKGSDLAPWPFEVDPAKVKKSALRAKWN